MLSTQKNRVRMVLVALFFFNSISLFAKPTYTEDQTQTWVGAPKKFFFDVTLGAHTPTTSGIGSGFAYGFNTGYKLQENTTVGLYLNRSSREPVSDVTISLMSFGGEIVYFPSKMYLLGLQAGPTVETGSFGAISVSDTEFSFGPKFGVTFPVTESFSLGFEPGVLLVFGEKTYAILHFPLVAQIWF